MKYFTMKMTFRRRKTGTPHPAIWENVPCQVDLAINVDLIAQRLGEKALSNKSRKSKLAVGVTCEVHPVGPAFD